MVSSHSSDLISIIGFAFLLIQTFVYVALRFRFSFAKKATQILPAQIKNVGLALIGLMQLNYMFTVYNSGTGHYQAILLFTLLILISYNSSYAALLDEAAKANLNLELIKKQSKGTADAYMELLGRMEKESKAAKEAQKVASSQETKEDFSGEVAQLKLNVRMLQEQVDKLKSENSSLKFENDEMRGKGFSAKKTQ